MQFNVDVTVRYKTKPTLLHQDLKRSQMGSIEGRELEWFRRFEISK
jgi:hypothetical protein